ncbi:GGDEF domain-containing protein [Alteromonas gilva]|uniref:diguanylate cyclase n=1 Tax=Alteromonas gilva TaxID=2987522 RepID=A0ABT5KY80_9ALTE|nr:GGDEF domain-containing protein [Alteromonas gilva]MDC8829730.1 GGDEF domain-containing protein [Alteromonas gilva]
MKYLPTLINSTLLPVIALSIGFTIISLFQAETLFWLQDKSWLPYPLLGIAALIASQFNQSRYFYACLLWLLLFTSIDAPSLLPQPFSPNTLILMLTGVTSVLIWHTDKSLRLSNLILTSMLIAGIAALIAWVLNSAVLTANPVYQRSSHEYAVLLPWLAQHFSLPEACLYALFFASAMVKTFVSPRLSHSLLAVSMVCLVIISQRFSLPLLAFAANLFAIMTVTVVLLNSHKMAFKDELTGIASRRALMHFTQSLFNNYSIVMADVDHFKSFNDKYGHDVGDQVLRMVAQQLNRVSQGGKAFRYGGEEFTLVFPGKNPEQVIETVDALRESIAQYAMVIRQPDRPKRKPKAGQQPKQATSSKTVHVTMSFGVAFKNKQVSFESALKQADGALYKAKKAGRNTVKIA